MANKSPFTRGYNEIRQKMETSSNHFIKSCFNCLYYYQGKGDSGEVCQNRDVLEYDMIVEGNNVFCLKWTQCNPKRKADTLFKKRGRERLE